MRFSDLEGCRIGVWGAGREIASLARQLRRLPRAAIVLVAADEPVSEGEREQLELGQDARFVSGPEAGEALLGCEVIVRSPGVRVRRPELERARAAGIPVTTATSLWLAEHGSAGVIGITGTKGKSTTASLCAHLARAAGREAELAGNIGAPALDLLDRPAAEPVVLELSSYQLSDLAVGPQVAVLTNLSREHTDWHGSEQAYRVDKLRLLGLPGVERVVINGAMAIPAMTAAELIAFAVPGGWQAAPTGVLRGGRLVIGAAQLPLIGAHNMLNLCAALAALEASGIVVPDPAAALADFQPLPHRLQPVLEHNGVLWVDDSISTTPDSAIAAISSFPERRLILLAGGQDRGQDHGLLIAELIAREATLIGVPSTGPRLLAEARAAGLAAELALSAEDLGRAVERAWSLAGPGTVVLLSPAAPSYDRYRDFEQRGERFQALVHDLAATG